MAQNHFRDKGMRLPAAAGMGGEGVIEVMFVMVEGRVVKGWWEEG